MTRYLRKQYKKSKSDEEICEIHLGYSFCPENELTLVLLHSLSSTRATLRTKCQWKTKDTLQSYRHQISLININKLSRINMTTMVLKQIMQGQLSNRSTYLTSGKAQRNFERSLGEARWWCQRAVIGWSSSRNTMWDINPGTCPTWLNNILRFIGTPKLQLSSSKWWFCNHNRNMQTTLSIVGVMTAAASRGC